MELRIYTTYELERSRSYQRQIWRAFLVGRRATTALQIIKIEIVGQKDVNRHKES